VPIGRSCSVHTRDMPASRGLGRPFLSKEKAATLAGVALSEISFLCRHYRRAPSTVAAGTRLVKRTDMRVAGCAGWTRRRTHVRRSPFALRRSPGDADAPNNAPSRTPCAMIHPMPHRAVTSAEISLPEHPLTGRVTERIAQLAQGVELVVLTDNHAGQARMSPLAAVALAREQGVRTVIHVSARDRNRLALKSQVVGAAALGCDGIVCLHGDNVPGIRRVGDMTGTELLAAAGKWVAPLSIARGCVLNPFSPDPGRELRLLQRKIECGATFAHTQMCFSILALAGFFDRAGEAGLLGRLRVYVTVGVLRNRAMADRARSLPGCDLPAPAYDQICAGGGRDLAFEMAEQLARLPVVDALHVMPLGDEQTAAEIASGFRSARRLDVGRLVASS
jgi:methylenetetrahydrofolate reductase (NADPH)